MAVGLVTFDESSAVYGDKKIEEFWLGLGKDDGLRIGDPRKAARVYLFEESSRPRLELGGSVKQAYTARYVANCFNAWIEGRNIRNSAVRGDALSPIFIRGSRFKGK
jgi:hypothetical protein